MNILLKSALINCLLFTAGALSPKDLCSQSNTKSLCSDGWGIPRKNMPQIVEAVRQEFLLTQPPHSVEEYHIEAHKLVPMQSEINGKSVYGMVRSFYKGLFNPCQARILVAKNDTHTTIIDGHHTATACRMIGGTQFVTAIRGAVSRIFSAIMDFPGVFRLSL